MILSISCDKSRNFIAKEYEGFWLDTYCKYEFKMNGTYKLSYEGHYDFNIERGEYIIKDKTIYLNPESDWNLLEGVVSNRLIMIDENCLRDKNNQYYCSKLEYSDNYKLSEHEFEKKAISKIDSLQIVKDYKYKFKSEKNIELETWFKRIIKVKNKDYYWYSLENLENYKHKQHLNFLIGKNPFEIYQHHTQRDSLSLIYKS